MAVVWGRESMSVPAPGAFPANITAIIYQIPGKQAIILQEIIYA
jgi:hypothetical protein